MKETTRKKVKCNKWQQKSVKLLYSADSFLICDSNSAGPHYAIFSGLLLSVSQVHIHPSALLSNTLNLQSLFPSHETKFHIHTKQWVKLYFL
jgi:hypothetical protein